MTADQIHRMSFVQLANALTREGTELTLEVGPTVTSPEGSREPAPPTKRIVTVRGAEAASLIKDRAAKVIAIQDKVGSLEPGKDADFVVWSGNPLSQFTKAEQTWVDGRRYFSLEDDARLRAQVDKERRQLIQAVLAASGNQQRTANGGRN